MAEDGERRSGEATPDPREMAFIQSSRKNLADAMQGWDRDLQARKDQEQRKSVKIRLDGPDYLNKDTAKERYGSEFPILCEFSVGGNQETWVVLRKNATDGKHALNSSEVNTLAVAKLSQLDEEAFTYKGKRHKRPTSPAGPMGEEEGSGSEKSILRVNHFTEREFVEGQTTMNVLYNDDNNKECLVTLTLGSDILEFRTDQQESVQITADSLARVSEEESLQNTIADETAIDVESPQKIAAQLLGVPLARTSYADQSESGVTGPELFMQVADETIPVPHGVLVLNDTSDEVIGFVDETGHFSTFTADQEGKIHLPAIVEKRVTEVESAVPSEVATESPDGDFPDPTYRTVLTDFYYKNLLAQQDEAARALLKRTLESRYSYVGRHGERAKKLPQIEPPAIARHLTARRAATDLRKEHR